MARRDGRLRADPPPRPRRGPAPAEPLTHRWPTSSARLRAGRRPVRRDRPPRRQPRRVPRAVAGVDVPASRPPPRPARRRGDRAAASSRPTSRLRRPACSAASTTTAASSTTGSSPRAARSSPWSTSGRCRGRRAAPIVETRMLAADDWVVIPTGVAHGFLALEPCDGLPRHERVRRLATSSASPGTIRLPPCRGRRSPRHRTAGRSCPTATRRTRRSSSWWPASAAERTALGRPATAFDRREIARPQGVLWRRRTIRHRAPRLTRPHRSVCDPTSRPVDRASTPRTIPRLAPRGPGEHASKAFTRRGRSRPPPARPALDRSSHCASLAAAVALAALTAFGVVAPAAAAAARSATPRS